MKRQDKLHARWSRAEDDLVFHHPAGSQTASDGGMLAYELTRLAAELTRRGYDQRTLKFSIEPMVGNDRFDSQRKDDEI